MIVTLATFLALTFSSCNEVENVKPINVKTKAQEAKTYCQDKGLNTSFCILVDFSMHSGKKRMFVYDWKKDSVVAMVVETIHGEWMLPEISRFLVMSMKAIVLLLGNIK